MADKRQELISTFQALQTQFNAEALNLCVETVCMIFPDYAKAQKWLESVFQENPDLTVIHGVCCFHSKLFDDNDQVMIHGARAAAHYLNETFWHNIAVNAILNSASAAAIQEDKTHGALC